LGAVVFRIMRKNIYLMILTFTIISATIVTAALLQSEQFKTSSYYVLASPQPKENINITALVQRLGKEDLVKALLNDAVNKDPIILTLPLT
jgi:energy-converting hydrogenase Eha subunit A